MQVSVESGDGLERKLRIAVPEDQISEAVQEKLQQLTRTVKIKGFRPGKVPLKVVRQRYGGQVREEVIGDLVQKTFYEAVSQENLRPAGMPSIDTAAAGEGEGLEYTATFEVYPEIEPADLSGRKIEVPATEIGDADVEQMLETIRKQNASWEEVARPCEKGDRVVIDYTGTIDGEVFAGGQGEDMSIELGQGRMIPGFEDGLVGASAGETRTLELTFPEDYHASELAGKPVSFEVTVKKVEGPRLPEVDDELAKRLGIAEGGVEAMRAEIRKSMEREADKALKERRKQAVMDALLEANPVDVPEALVSNEAQNMASQMASNLMQQGMQREQATLDPSIFRDQAERRVKLGLVLAEIVKRQDMKVEPSRLREAVEAIAAPYEHPEEVVKWYFGDKQRLSEVESAVLEEQVVEWALEQMEVIENKVTFDDLMNPQGNDNN